MTRSLPIWIKILVLLNGKEGLQVLGVVFLLSALFLPIIMEGHVTSIRQLSGLLLYFMLAIYWLHLIWKARYDLPTLLEGRITKGNLTYKKWFDRRIMNKRGCDFTYRFTDVSGKEYTTSFQSYKGLELQDEELLIYHPSAPEKALVIEALDSPLRNYILKHWL
ncbi:hypothetical protein [Croceimicrobium hydrocarbonivorans]|uniref:DUF3592 domain-containing protein n=1 Tax=Croceimicrobium hydrocarbonivorans TaxID=2761580 RepID=A0A7H0VA26_9FLAO|nr:hypothetical protein [Croceimicrobium hydrocarbonivorans]QNR22574.1 hypothetical protein H4K34_09250 [Croceimicrobium hydrocarbonivorans]